MPLPRVVRGQQVRQEKADRAKQLRREMTPAERVLWQRLRGTQLTGLHFRRQQVIAGFIVDFYCHAARVIVNVDGAIHDDLAVVDAERDTILTAHGFLSLHVTNTEVISYTDAVVTRIELTCRQALQSHTDAAEPNHEGTPSRIGKGSGVRFPR